MYAIMDKIRRCRSIFQYIVRQYERKVNIDSSATKAPYLMVGYATGNISQTGRCTVNLHNDWSIKLVRALVV